MRRATTAVAAALLAACGSTPTQWPRAAALDFATATQLDNLAFTQPDRWRWSDAGGSAAIELLGKSDYTPPFRSPFSLAIYRGLAFGDFDLEVDLLQTGPEYAHRDLCLIFAFQAPDRFGYVHLASKPDPNAHNVFVVDGAPRRSLLPPPAQGIDWGRDQWHHVRIERRVATGEVRVYWDRGATPILALQCPEFGPSGLTWGQIGLGSFDDSGRFTNLVVTAPQTRVVPNADPFARR